MKLQDLQPNNSKISIRDIISAMKAEMGAEQVGGARRVYDVDGKLGVVFIVSGGPEGVGIVWERGAKTPDAIYVWKHFSVFEEPDVAIDIPENATLENSLQQIIHFIARPKIGLVESDGSKLRGSKKTLKEARQVDAATFIDMVLNDPVYSSKAHAMSLVDMSAVAKKNDVTIPGAVRTDRSLKIDAHHWNLSKEDPADVNRKLGDELGGTVEDPNKHMDPVYNDQIALAKVQTLNRLVQSKKIYLMGRKSNGAFFRIPGLEEATAQLERMLVNSLSIGEERTGMAEQYQQLIDKVELVAGGKSNFIKSLLITGAPSSGKTFSVMKTIRELGLEEGRDYVVKKGHITTKGMLRVLIEQINGLVIFDDCDSVVEEKQAVNMLKGALDTDPIREISYDVQGGINTAVMRPEQRMEYVEAISRILRGEETRSDLEMFLNKLKKKKRDKEPVEESYLREADYDDDDIPDDEDDDIPEVQHIVRPGVDYSPFKYAGATYDYYEAQDEIQSYLSTRLPNKIDFKGRIIFISNMDESEWDTAILTRAFYVNMNFTDAEMLDYIDQIKHNIKTPGVSEDEKQEVMDYLRELWTMGKLKRTVNFRLIQAAFDLRLTNDWRKLISIM
jgi:hypothetical protein